MPLSLVRFHAPVRSFAGQPQAQDTRHKRLNGRTAGPLLVSAALVDAALSRWYLVCVVRFPAFAPLRVCVRIHSARVLLILSLRCDAQRNITTLDKHGHFALSHSVKMASYSRVLVPRPPRRELLPNVTGATTSNSSEIGRLTKRRRVACQRCRLSKVCIERSPVSISCLRYTDFRDTKAPL